MENRNHNAKRSGGGVGGKVEGYSRRHKEPVDCVCMCARARRSFVLWSLDWNQSRQLANGGQGDKERERGGEIGRKLLRVVEKGAGEKAPSPSPGLKVGTWGN